MEGNERKFPNVDCQFFNWQPARSGEGVKYIECACSLGSYERVPRGRGAEGPRLEGGWAGAKVVLLALMMGELLFANPAEIRPRPADSRVTPNDLTHAGAR
ncbi:hypothetical protein Mp_2g22210 [Marchantia polymorpha subsp. ruderalis]|uniref:Uncharacterized protein n=1 Tax=Marchantia polymorpha TaxID=3197 RepID=A0A2R6WNF4_MARPO|nr:hypothetical protein MARPO_0072s0106 [Marchantia polymorpha]BBN03275.1 hypothetical protein Mp_2g22210 [Marchantia polymorpha subsp. ruderalis]|eukprot:PTQ35373.1 hypothetical protein MARPO_0072s0106 [Marchantia polymorpha]